MNAETKQGDVYFVNASCAAGVDLPNKTKMSPMNGSCN